MINWKEIEAIHKQYPEVSINIKPGFDHNNEKVIFVLLDLTLNGEDVVMLPMGDGTHKLLKKRDKEDEND